MVFSTSASFVQAIGLLTYSFCDWDAILFFVRMIHAFAD